VQATELSAQCAGCARASRRAYRFHELVGVRLRCLGCALTHRPLLRRSLSIALVVGTVLVAINQGDALLGGHWNGALAWKVPLTYVVPFVVATWGALLNCRVSLDATPSKEDVNGDRAGPSRRRARP